MKHPFVTAAVALAALCCTILPPAGAAQGQPAVTQTKPIAVASTVPASVSVKVNDIAKPAAGHLDAGTAPTSPAPAAPAQPDLSAYTGILIDASAFASIQRSPAPAIYGPDGALIYPDRTRVPTPDQVQDESIVRYYRTMTDAKAGVGGSNPLVLTPTAVIGPAKDSVVLSAADVATFLALDKKLHYFDTWKVGFVIPANQ